MLLRDFFESVYKPLRLTGRSEKTCILYRRSIVVFSETLMRDATLQDLTDLNVARHLGRLLELGRRAPGVNKERSQLMALWNLAARKKYVDEFGEVPPIPEPELMPKAWSHDELTRLKSSCDAVKGTYSGVPANKWWLALHCVLWSTGERIGPVLRLTFSAIENGTIFFPASHRKGRKKANLCSVPEYCIEAIEDIREPTRELVFACQCHESTLYNRYTKILERAGLETDKYSKFHRMRRSHATHLKIAGGDPVQSLMHAKAETTQAYLDRRLIPSGIELLKPFGERVG